MLQEIIIGALGNAALNYAGSRSIGWLKSAAAKKEMASIAADSLNVAAQQVPDLAEDFRSASFADGVIAPTIRLLVDDPSQLPDPERLAVQFIDKFVQQFGEKEGVDAALNRVFRTERAALIESFAVFLRELRSRLGRSRHWQELAHFSTTEATFRNTATLISILDRVFEHQKAERVDLAQARQDARTGSGELRSWPRAILGHELKRSEFECLKSTLLSKPSKSILLIGDAGSGKSAFLAKLTEELEGEGVAVFGIKADTLPVALGTFEDIALALGMTGPLLPALAALSNDQPVVLIIDQMDAVSDVMDRTSQRMKVLLRLVHEVRQQELPVHVVVSSRPFEAAHDARFQQLGAEEVHLTLPSTDAIQAFLSELDIDCGGASEALRDTLRRPFALKLYVDLVSRGEHPDAVDPGSLLDRWLSTADLGSDSERRAVLDLMDQLATDMLDTETLWRPVNAYEARSKDALVRAEACGLVIRSGRKIAFSHQSWLDDFQARRFRTGLDLAEYVWCNQDSLFVRSTVLRSLQRLRQFEPEAYRRAVLALLWGAKTRRHVLHLVVDVISISIVPSKEEGAWASALIDRDSVLANRALGQIAERWSAWRDQLGRRLPALMTNPDFHWRVTQLLAAEAKVDLGNAVDLIKQNWGHPQHDRLVFRVVEQSGVWTPGLEELVGEILNRTAIDQYAVSHLVKVLRTSGLHHEACRVVGLWFDVRSLDGEQNPSLHGVDKLVKAAPREFAEVLLPRFLGVAMRDVAPSRPGLKRYPKSRSLNWDWTGHGDPDKVLGAFRDAMNKLAASEPEAAVTLLDQLQTVEVDQVQDITAQTFVSGGAALVHRALTFLLADERRLQIGDGYVTREPGCTTCEIGLTSQELLEAISPQLSDVDIARVRDHIEGWSLYGSEFMSGDDPRTRFERVKWAEGHRMELLERLPSCVLSPRRRRQVKEWREAQKTPLPRRDKSSRMATLIGSPMSCEKMVKARDEDLFAMLDEINDQAPERSCRRPLSMDGGVIELSRDFGKFAQEHPERAIALCRERFIAGRHEHAAAELVNKVSDLDYFPTDRLLALIHELADKGFKSETWKTHASWALAKLAGKRSGLPDESIRLLESWLENDPVLIAERVERRLASEVWSADRGTRERAAPQPLIFGQHGAVEVVPQDNYSILDAIFRGLIHREDHDYDQWLTILERHADRAEDPHVWSFLLASTGRWLINADRERVGRLLTHLWQREAKIFHRIDLGGLLWSARSVVPDDLIIAVITAWSADSRDEWRQAAGEVAEAFRLVEPSTDVAVALCDVLADVPSPALTGRLFTAAAAWRDGDSALRENAHDLLMKFVAVAEWDQAHAISSAVDQAREMPADDLTREFIVQVADNDAVLEASLTGWFAEGLQALLLYPGFDESVMRVAECVSDRIADKSSGAHRAGIEREFVQVAIALQRSNGPICARAMDAYEKLLDAGAYGAEEAAKDVLRL